jgi:hypothetical protein
MAEGSKQFGQRDIRLSCAFLCAPDAFLYGLGDMQPLCDFSSLLSQLVKFDDALSSGIE